MKALLRYLLWSLLFILLVLTGVLGFAVSTQTGLNTLIALAQKVLPGTLTYERIEGRLIGPLEIDKLGYQDGELAVSLKEAKFDWSPSDLLSGQLHIGVLKTDGLELHLPAGPPAAETPPSAPLQLSDIPLPLQVEIADLAVTDTRIWPPGAAEPVVIDAVILQAGTEGRAINLRTLEIDAPQGNVKLNGQLELSGDNPLELHLNGTFKDPQYGPLTAEGVVQGELNKTLALNFDVSGAVTAKLEGTASQVLTDPGWQAQLTLKASDLGKFVPELAGSELAAKLQTQGSVNAFQASGELSTQLPEVGPVTASFQVSGSPEQITVREFAVNAANHPLSLTAQADVNLAGQTVDASGQWKSLAWPLTGTPQVESPEGDFTLKGSLQDYKLVLKTALAGPDFGKLNAQIEAAGSDQAVTLSKLAVRAPGGKLALNVQGNFSFADQAFQATGTWQSLAWPLTGTPQIESPKGEFTAKGTPKDYQLRLQADLSSTEAGELKALVQAAGTDKAVQVSELSLRAPDGKLALNAQGEFSFADLAFQAAGEWQSLAWPLIGTPQVESPSGTFKASGNIKDYQFKLNTQIQGPDIPKSDWSLEGQGSDQAVKDVTLKSRLLEGEIQADINAAWQPAVRWQVDLSGSGLNPGEKWPELPGKLALKLQTEGGLSNGKLAATVGLNELSGSLAGQEVQGKAQLVVKDQDLTIETLQLSAGSARLTAAGGLTQTWDLRWELKAPDLRRLLPAAAGSVSASGTVTGPRDKPRAQLTLSVDKLALGETSIRRLRGEATVDVSGDSQSQLNFTGSDLRLAGQTWQTLNLKGSGTPAAHTLQAGLAGELGRFELALAGSFDEKSTTWQGELARLSAKGTQVGDWNLNKPMPLRVSAQQAAAEQSCLVSPPTRICLQGRWDAQTGAEGQVSLENLTAQRFAELLPEGVRINTSLSGEASGATRPDGSMQGRVSLRLRPGDISIRANGSPLKIALGGGELLQAESNGRDATAKLSLDLGKIGQVNANVQINDLRGQGRLNGKVNTNIKDLAIVKAFVPQVDNVAGRITANLDLGGRLTAPTIGGAVRLENAAVDVPEFGTQVKEIQLSAVSDGKGALQLSGFARSGDGDLRLSGQLQPTSRELELSIKGNNFEVANSPEIQALINPDLNLSVQQDRIRVEGTVVIPEARISPAGSGGSSASRVTASPDVVIVREADGSEPAAPEPGGAAIYVKVRVILKKVTVAAFDFRGKLKGNILVEQTPQLAPRASGSVEVEAGDYDVYGQTLNIERGRVLFSNSPLDNPGLDLRVSRTIDDVSAGAASTGAVTVGAEITGTATNPSLRLFSTPPMPDGTKLSYLVLGRPPDTGTSGSVTLGKYLAPNLYIGYAVALGQAANTFLMRYKISNKLTVLGTSSSESTGADLLYTIELR